MFDVIERLKADWTDKYVVINSSAPELARFAKTTGQVKTVNMNGRCLVEFDQYNNIGWYDIDPAALKIVPKPAPKPPEEKPAKAAPAAKAAPSAKAAPAKPAPAAGAKKPSTADILAAARGKQAAAAAAPAAPTQAEPAPEAEAPEAEAPPAVAPKAKRAAGGPQPTTTAEKIAWCRAHDAKG